MKVVDSKPAFVLDASIALMWCFDDESTPEAWALLDRLCQETALVPQLWCLEIGNALIQAERRGRLTEANSSKFLNLLERLNVQIDNDLDPKTLNNTIMLARRYQLSVYDAVYLALAHHKNLPLATRDKALRQAAQQMKIDILPEGSSL